LFIEEGKVLGKIPPGTYTLAKSKKLLPGTALVYFNTSQLRSCPFSIPEVLTKDDYKIGLSCENAMIGREDLIFPVEEDLGGITYKVSDPEAAYKALGLENITDEDKLHVLVKKEIRSVLHSMLTNLTVREIERLPVEKYEEVIARDARPRLERIGIQFVSISKMIAHIPDDVKRILNEAKEDKLGELDIKKKEKELAMAQIQAKADLALDAERRKLDHQDKETDTRLRVGELTSLASSGVMDKVDYTKLLQAEGMKDMLKNSTIQANSFESVGGLSMTAGSSVNDAKVKEIKDVEAMIKKLDDRLIMGEISEEKHSELLARLNQRLLVLKDG